MSNADLTSTVQGIVGRAAELKRRHARLADGTISYSAIFCHSEDEYSALDRAARRMGILANDTVTGSVYVVTAIPTSVGDLRIVKVRKPDPTRPERGDADFALSDYETFKSENLDKPGFTLIRRPEFEMIELADPEFDVRVYFSHPPVEEHAGIKEALAKFKG